MKKIIYNLALHLLLVIDPAVFSLSTAATKDYSIERELSQPLIFTYEPYTQVTDHAAIDQDQKLIEVELATISPTGFLNAYEVYKNGAYSKSYAILKITTPSKTNYAKGTYVSGRAVNGELIGGTLIEDVAENSDELKVQYDIQSDLGSCRVGGNPHPITTGCFEESSSVTVDNMDTYLYTYDLQFGNVNGRTIAGFSEEAQEKMQDCVNCPYEDFQKFFKYYGKADYADRWIRAAFDQGRTDFSNGNADFTDYSADGAAEVVRRSTVYMGMWMAVIREMENALDDCENKCLDCDDPIHRWDEAVAYYVGSLQDDYKGYLMFYLANEQCSIFSTCGQNGNELVGDAKVNIDIFKEFDEGKMNLIAWRCSDARINKENIVRSMAIPLIQATLRYAHIQSDIDINSGETAHAAGAAFAAAVLPIIHACDNIDAQIIYNNMRVRSLVNGFVDFDEVKTAFERNYGCLGIECSDVGGLSDMQGSYLKGAFPCGGDSSSGQVDISTNNGNASRRSEDNIGMSIGICIGLLCFAAFIVLMCCRTWKSGPIILDESITCNRDDGSVDTGNVIT